MSEHEMKKKESVDDDLKLMYLNRKILHYAFVVPTKRISENLLLSLLYWIFTPVAFAFYFFILTSQALGVYHYWGDLDVTMEDLFLTLGFVMCYWEGAYFKVRKGKIWKIFDILDNIPLPIVRYVKLKEIHMTDMKEVMSQCRFVSWFIFLSVNVGTLMWAIFPLVNLMIHKMSENSEQEDDELRKANKPWPYLMYIIWVPYDETRMPMYAVTYAIQVFVYFTASLYNTISNIIFINLVLHATGKFKIVESSFLFIEEVIAKNGSGNKTEINIMHKEDGTSVEEEKNNYLTHRVMFNIEDFHVNDDEETNIDNRLLCTEVEHFLIDCIRQHQEAIAFTHELNVIVSPWIMFSLLIHQLLLVAEVFQLVLTAGSGFAILKHIMSIIGVLSQSLLLCWLGDRLIHQSLRVKAAAYSCKWYDQSARFKKLLHMVIKRAQEPVKLSAGHFYDINIEKFDKILRRAYSYYAVLREMKET